MIKGATIKLSREKTERGMALGGERRKAREER